MGCLRRTPTCGRLGSAGASPSQRRALFNETLKFMDSKSFTALRMDRDLTAKCDGFHVLWRIGQKAVNGDCSGFAAIIT